MQQTTVQLKEVEGHTSKAGKAYWKAKDSIGTEYAIFDGALAQTATALVGQQVVLSFTTTQKGDYPPSHSLKAISQAGPGAVVTANPPAQAQNGGAVPQQVLHVTTTEDKSDRIERQSAYKAAVDWVSKLNNGDDSEHDLWPLVQQRTEQLAYYAKHGRWMDTELPVPVAAEGDEDWA